MPRLCTALLLTLFLSLSGFAGTTADLKKGFATPPDSVRPWVYWVWMDGNLTKEGITADLEAMKRAGIGGMIIMEVNVGIPQGPVEFMSPVWRQHFKHVVKEAERLGLEISLITGPGWTGSGGPWVKPEQGMKHIVGMPTVVTGPRRFDDTLARPQRRPAFFGDGLLPPAREQEKNAYYRDLMVLAYPTPAPTAPIPGIDEKAFYTRAPYSSQPTVPSFFPTFAQYPAPVAGTTIDPARVIDITGSFGADGKLHWDVPAGSWTIMRLGATSTGSNTRPAPVPGLGLECDKLDTNALNAHFDAFFGTLIREIGPRDLSAQGGWKMVHIDSWEMGAQNWTGAFREEFRQRRGYDLLPYLPAITGATVGSREISERFLWDLRQTVQELVLQNHAGHLKTLGQRHGFTLSIEPYDMNPTSDMSLGSVADVPMCEFWMYGFHTSYSVIEATSIAHTTGRSVVGAEAFTSADTEHWDAWPGSMKVLGDWAFAQGVNRFVFHRYQHQPWNSVKPGVTMGPYGVHWERTQSWWDLAPGYHTYLSRAQFMLRQGLAVADVCFLVGEGAPQVFQAPRSALRGNPPDRTGYRFDACAPEVLMARASVHNGDIVFPDGMRYRVLVLPDRETMTPALLRKVKALVAAGATVIGPPPLRSPALSGYPACDDEIAALTKDALLRYGHRRLGDADIYFVANPSGIALDAECTFRVAGKQPECWDPVTGTTRVLHDITISGGRTKARIRFEPHQSFFIVFNAPAVAQPGRRVMRETVLAHRIKGPWEVTFSPSWSGPGTMKLDALSDWSENRMDSIRYFSGIATYRKTFDVPGPLRVGKESGDVYLDLGVVHDMARVRLNGKDLGIVWTPPMRVSTAGALRAKGNVLEIDVANRWRNRLVGDERFAADAEYGPFGNIVRWPEWLTSGGARPSTGRAAFASWRHFTASTPLLPSGLLGPVQLMMQGE
ncbi:MAG: glycosyl hydrolase [Ignavibacteriae bacterium]|nr:glycosyl hydrolase [Ignavibacteriota bacterium]